MSKIILGIIFLVVAIVVGSLSVQLMINIDLVQGRFMDEVRTSWTEALFISGGLSLMLGVVWSLIGRKRDLYRYPEEHKPFGLWYVIFAVALVATLAVVWVYVLVHISGGFETVMILSLLVSTLVYTGISWISAPVHLRRVPLHFVFKNRVA